MEDAINNYPMKNTWKCYQMAPTEKAHKNWIDSMKQICTINEFSRLMFLLDEIKSIGLESFMDFNFFKNDIMPMWEDPVNSGGGRIIMEVPLSQKEMLHTLWAKTLVFCALEMSEGINGCVFSEKANYRICIWIADPSLVDEILPIWKYVLDCNTVSFSFSLHNKHNDNQRSRKGYSRNKSRF